MAQESFGAVVKRRLLGVLFLVMVIALVSLSILIYNKAFTDTVDVTLKAEPHRQPADPGLRREGARASSSAR